MVCDMTNRYTVILLWSGEYDPRARIHRETSEITPTQPLPGNTLVPDRRSSEPRGHSVPESIAPQSRNEVSGKGIDTGGIISVDLAGASELIITQHFRREREGFMQLAARYSTLKGNNVNGSKIETKFSANRGLDSVLGEQKEC
jgi:hypothetical protein